MRRVSMKRALRLARSGPDFLLEELAAILSGNEWVEFKPLFLIVHAQLRLRKAAGGGEEMLRLRAYDKLQGLVRDGIVEKEGKRYRAIPSNLAAFVEQL